MVQKCCARAESVKVGEGDRTGRTAVCKPTKKHRAEYLVYIQTFRKGIVKLVSVGKDDKANTLFVCHFVRGGIDNVVCDDAHLDTRMIE